MGPQTKILVVEDEAIQRFMIGDSLVEAGFEVLEASNAEEAIKLLERHSDIRLIFSDIDMPGSMDGLRLVAAVRNRWPPIKIILTSGKRAPDQWDIPLGALFLPKPYAAKAVSVAMREMLAA